MSTGADKVKFIDWLSLNEHQSIEFIIDSLKNNYHISHDDIKDIICAYIDRKNLRALINQLRY